MAMRTYDDEFVARVKDYAVIGLYPVQIAERLGLEGEDRKEFLQDIRTHKHPLREEYLSSRANMVEDLDASLNDLAAAGDVDALELESKIRFNKEVDNLKMELFDV